MPDSPASKAGTPVLNVKDLRVSYGAVRALHGVSLQVNAGEVVTLIGSNGAGKSSTLRAISGLVRAAAGSIEFEGKPITKLAPHQIVKLGLIQSPEGRGVFPNMSVHENLELGGYARSDHEQIAIDREKALDLFPRLRERLAQMAGTLSGGEQQMLAMARALISKPRLLLLDEPSLGLAPQIVQTIFKIIRDINATGTTILLVEQNAHMALQVAHRAYVIETGRIVMEGDAKTLAQSDEVRKAYLGVA
jgi:branched-chain amino acid transport system ATP-binding protein